MSKILANAIGIHHNPDNAHDHSQRESDVVKSVFHVALLPLGLALASPLAGVIYFLFAIGAYFTLFREKNYYVIGILKTAAAITLAASAWIVLIGFLGSLGASL